MGIARAAQDMEAVLWLESYLAAFPKILFIISHSQDFMNNVCTNIIHMQDKKLVLYGGNYDTVRLPSLYAPFRPTYPTAYPTAPCTCAHHGVRVRCAALQYRQIRAEKEEHQMKRYNWEQEQIKHMKDYIARFGHGSAKLAKQAQSKEKTLAKMERAGLTKKVRGARDWLQHVTPPATRGMRTRTLVEPAGKVFAKRG